MACLDGDLRTVRLYAAITFSNVQELKRLGLRAVSPRSSGLPRPHDDSYNLCAAFLKETGVGQFREFTDGAHGKLVENRNLEESI